MALTCRHLDYVPWLAQVVVRRTLLIYFIISAIFLAILILVVWLRLSVQVAADAGVSEI